MPPYEDLPTKPDLAASRTRRSAAAATRPPLASNIYYDKKLPYAGDEKKKGRRFFYEANRSGFNLEMHETVLGPGVETHAPHKHVHEEILVIVEGTVERYLDGKTEIVEAGSVIVQGSNQMHNVRNVGTVPCRYYIIEVRGNEA